MLDIHSLIYLVNLCTVTITKYPLTSSINDPTLQTVVDTDLFTRNNLTWTEKHLYHLYSDKIVTWTTATAGRSPSDLRRKKFLRLQEYNKICNQLCLIHTLSSSAESLKFGYDLTKLQKVIKVETFLRHSVVVHQCQSNFTPSSLLKANL